MPVKIHIDDAIIMDHEIVAIVSPNINSSTRQKLETILDDNFYYVPEQKIQKVESGSVLEKEFIKTTATIRSKAKGGLLKLTELLELLEQLQEKLEELYEEE